MYERRRACLRMLATQVGVLCASPAPCRVVYTRIKYLMPWHMLGTILRRAVSEGAHCLRTPNPTLNRLPYRIPRSYIDAPLTPYASPSRSLSWPLVGLLPPLSFSPRGEGASPLPLPSPTREREHPLLGAQLKPPYAHNLPASACSAPARFGRHSAHANASAQVMMESEDAKQTIHTSVRVCMCAAARPVVCVACPTMRFPSPPAASRYVVLRARSCCRRV